MTSESATGSPDSTEHFLHEYFEDPLPELTTGGHDDYVYVTTDEDEEGTQGHLLDDAETLLQQLQELGINVKEEYVTLDYYDDEQHSSDEDYVLLDVAGGVSEGGVGGKGGGRQREKRSPSSSVKQTDKRFKVSEKLRALKLLLEKLPVEFRSRIARHYPRLQKYLFAYIMEHRPSWASVQSFGSHEFSYDTMTPDSGVHENFASLSPEEQERQREEWKSELTKTEEEIQTLRHVLESKVKHSQDLKRRLGITVWREFAEDVNASIKYVRESQTVVKANEKLQEMNDAVTSAPLVVKANEKFKEINDAVTSAPLYQKTAGAMSAVGEKTTSLFGGIGAKLKENQAFKSFEEKVGSAYSAAKTRIGGPGSNSTTDFDEAVKAEEEKQAAANGGTGLVTTPGSEQAPAAPKMT